MRNRLGRIVLTVVAGALAVWATELMTRWHAERWHTAANPESTSLMPAVIVIFFTAMLVFAVGGAIWPRTYAQPIAAAAVVTVGISIVGVVIGGMVLGSIMSGGAGKDRILPVMIIGGTLAGAIAAFAICLMPVREAPRTAALIQAAVALIALVFMLPWQRLALTRVTPEQRHAEAQRSFGPTYDHARRTILQCQAFDRSVGGLKSLAISPRRNAVMDEEHFTGGYYDFDYIGGRGKGRVTVQVEYLKPIRAGHPYHPPRAGRFTGGNMRSDFTLYVYPDYATKWTNMVCPPP